MKNIILKNSVGKGGTNNPEDVKSVQSALKRIGYNVTVDGKFGNQTLSAINSFQKATFNGFSDGLISPNKGTMNKLNETPDGTKSLDSTKPLDNTLSNISDVAIKFGKNAMPKAVGGFFKNLLIDAAKEAGLDSLTITSTARRPVDQARAMYENIKKSGAAAQKKLYGKYGDMVIDAYVEAKNAGMDAAGIQEAMTKKIIEVGPSKISKHLSKDISKVQVVDISPRSISNKTAFVDAVTKLQNEGKINSFLHPGNSKDPALSLIHI